MKSELLMVLLPFGSRSGARWTGCLLTGASVLAVRAEEPTLLDPMEVTTARAEDARLAAPVAVTA